MNSGDYRYAENGRWFLKYPSLENGVPDNLVKQLPDPHTMKYKIGQVVRFMHPRTGEVFTATVEDVGAWYNYDIKMWEVFYLVRWQGNGHTSRWATNEWLDKCNKEE